MGIQGVMYVSGVQRMACWLHRVACDGIHGFQNGNLRRAHILERNGSSHLRVARMMPHCIKFDNCIDARPFVVRLIKGHIPELQQASEGHESSNEAPSKSERTLVVNDGTQRNAYRKE